MSNTSPRVSPTERELIERSKRYEENLPPMLVRVAGAVVQLPQAIALDLIRLRKASVVSHPNAVATLTLSEDDIDEELLEQFFGGTHEQ
jgi:hypothetical protein